MCERTSSENLYMLVQAEQEVEYQKQIIRELLKLIKYLEKRNDE